MRLKEKNAKVMLILNFPFRYKFLEVELTGCDHDLRTMMEHFPLTVHYFIYSIPKTKCRPGHLNVNILNMAISHSLHLKSLHHNPHYHQHQHQPGRYNARMKPQLLMSTEICSGLSS